MNKYKNRIWTLLLPLLLLGVVGCEHSIDDNPVLDAASKKAPVLSLVNASQSNIVISLDEGGTLDFKWEAADYGQQIPATYSLEMSNAAGDKVVSLPTTDGVKEVSHSLINLNKQIIDDLGLEAEKAGEVNFTLISLPLLESGAPAASDLELRSNTITVTITPETPPAPLYPEAVYMIGAEFGNWDWGSESVVEMIPVNSNHGGDAHAGKFWAVRYFSGGDNGFKWNTVKSWGGDFFSLGNDVGFTTADGNAFVADPGFYIVVIDYTSSTITIEPAQVFGIGDAFGSWDNFKEEYKFVPEGKTLVSESNAKGNLRMYAYSKAAGIGGDWWRMEFNIYDGLLRFRGNEPDDIPPVPVAANKKITLNFNAATGQIGNPGDPVEPEPEPTYPEALYMIGQQFGDWKWDSDQVVEMVPVNGHEGKFWAIRYFINPEDGFKWNSERKWGGDFNSLGKDVGFTTKDGNAFVSEAGLYIVVVDYTTETITIEPAKVFGIGDAFGSWDTNSHPFTLEGQLLRITTSGAGELRIYAASDAAGIGGDWWRMEFIILDGKIAYRGNGGDQERVPVEANKTVTLDFNAGTGEIK